MGFLPTLGGIPSATGLTISQATAMAVSAVYCCVTILSQDVARCTPRLFRRQSDGSRVQDTDHPLNRIFRRPNRQQSWFEFMEQQSGAHHLRGNAYAAIKRDGRGVVRELIPINPDAVLVLEAVDGSIFYQVSRFGLWQIAVLREFPYAIAEDDIFHLRGLSFNSLVGLSTIGMARDSIGVAMGLEQQTARQMANGARPSMVLEADKKISPDTAKRLGQQFRDSYGGIGNTGGIPVLEDGMKANQLQLTSVDLEFMAQRAFQLQDIARFYRVPPHKLGTDQLRGVNIVQMDQDYVNNTVMPHLHRWEQKFDQVFGLAEQGLEIDMDETVLLRADIATRYNSARIGLLSGFISPNEVRAGEDLAPVEGGDEVFRPLNMAALGSDMTGTSPDGAGHPSAAEGEASAADATDGAAQREEQQNAGGKKLIQARSKGANKTLYVSRKLVNAEDIIAWAKEQGFATTLPAADMHVTIAYSKQPVDWDAIADQADPLTVKRKNGRALAVFGEGACVLKFSSGALADRWQEFVDAGASWDWPEYQPHVTLTYAAGEMNLDEIEPYSGPLEFGPEIFAEIDETWKDNVEERSNPRFAGEDAQAFLEKTLSGVDEQTTEPREDRSEPE